jgi:hypothetical protein
MTPIALQEAVMQTLPHKKMLTFASAIALTFLATLAPAKKKEKAPLPDFVLKAQTILVVILPNSGEPMNDAFANRRAQEDVEKALMKWGRYRIALDANTADLVIGVRKGTGQDVSPTMNGGPIDSPNRPGTIETTDNAIRIGAQQGRPPATSQDPTDIDAQNSPTDKPHPGMAVGEKDDTFEVFQGGVPYPVDNAPVWKLITKDGLKPPSVSAVEQFRKAVEESEKAAAQKQQKQQQQQPQTQQQPQPQTKNP